MSDNRKYYYLKLKENYFDEDAIVLLESMQDGVFYSNILLKLYLKSLKNGGKLQLDENIPYTAQMIATITRQQVGTVERALQIFMKLGLVEPLQNGALYMSNIELLIGQSSTEGERKRRARLALQGQKALPKTGADKCPPYQADICPPELEIEKEIEIEKEREGELDTGQANLIMMKASNQINLNQFMEQSNEIGVQQQRITKEKAELLAKQDGHKVLDMDAIEATLCEAVEFTNGKVSDWFIQNFVRRITPIDDTRFAWVLDLAPEPQTLVCEVNGRKEYPRITLESNLYKGAWPSLPDSYHPFLLDGEGHLNGDISSSGLEQDRLQSRISTGERVATYMVKIPLLFPYGKWWGDFYFVQYTQRGTQTYILAKSHSLL